jgi:AcrR family transcriptional regulator
MVPKSTAATVRPMRKDAQRNNELVLRAARETLAEFGSETRVEQIAARAGVGVGTVYRHFPNKEALIDELVRLLLTDLVGAARTELAREDGSGLETFLRVLGRAVAEQRGYIEKLLGQTRTDCGQLLLRGLIGELLEQARAHGQVGPDIVLGDVLATTWGMRGVIATTGSVAPDAWERYLDIHLAGLRATARPGTSASISTEQLSRITGTSH